jgi:hypothetical protein
MTRTKYSNLVSILDLIRNEAPTINVRYHANFTEPEKLNKARARAFIHLFLKVKFGLTDFTERENLVTDDVDDGGIDGYFIDKGNKKLYFIQSKFRCNESNFENKEITLEELLSMDIQRITTGETTYSNGNRYNNKIQNLIKSLQDISDLPKYEYKVILLANIKLSLEQKIDRIAGGFKVEVYNYERCYNDLVFPIVSGTYYNSSELKILIDIDSSSAGHRIDYDVKTEFYECNVNAFFVSTLEIAKILSKYKNAILTFNPRSYLDLKSGAVNSKIAKSITDIGTNEFALFNNGITMLSDSTNYSDKVGKKNKAEVIITNPQIINGGQTAYTLSLLYDDCLSREESFEIFNGKEVLLKIITFNEDDSYSSENNGNRLKLIEDISIATNQQTPVNEADRRANDKVQVELQKAIFKEFGLFYERKRGEYGDGLHLGYITRDQIIDREIFLRICLCAQNSPESARRLGQNDLFNKTFFDYVLPNTIGFKKYVFTYKAYLRISSIPGHFGLAKSTGKYAVTCVISNKFSNSLPISEYDDKIIDYACYVLYEWVKFETYAMNQNNGSRHFKTMVDELTGNIITNSDWNGYYKGGSLIKDLNYFFNLGLEIGN